MSLLVEMMMIIPTNKKIPRGFEPGTSHMLSNIEIECMSMFSKLSCLLQNDKSSCGSKNEKTLWRITLGKNIAMWNIKAVYCISYSLKWWLVHYIQRWHNWIYVNQTQIWADFVIFSLLCFGFGEPILWWTMLMLEAEDNYLVRFC